MAEVKDKVVTVESLNVLHTYGKNTYVSKADATNIFARKTDIETHKTQAEETYAKKTDIISVSHGGTGSSNGATGLQNLFGAGATVLSSYQYGDALPAAGAKGRIFFKRIIE